MATFTEWTKQNMGITTASPSGVKPSFTSWTKQMMGIPDVMPAKSPYTNDAAGFHQLEQDQMHPIIPPEYMPAVFHMIESATKDQQVDYQKLANDLQPEVDKLQKISAGLSYGGASGLSSDQMSNYAQQVQEELNVKQARLKRFQDAAKKQYDEYMAQPAELTPAEQKAQGMKDEADKTNGNIFQQAWHLVSPTAEKKAYNDYVNSDQFITDNLSHWKELASKPVLTTAERDEVKLAYQVLKKKASDLRGTWGQGTDAQKQTANGYDTLASIFYNKYSTGASIAGGTLAAVPFVSKWSDNANQKIAQVMTPYLGDNEIGKIAQADHPMQDVQAAHPGAFTAGNILGSVVLMEAGGGALGTLGVSSQIARNAIIFGAQNMANGIANGESADKIIGDTITGVFGGAVGSKVGKVVGGAVIRGLYESGLSTKAIQVMASTSTGLSFAATSTAAEEAKSAIYEGKDYAPDATSITVNLITAALFGTLEAFKSNPKVAKVQADLKAGAPGAQQEAVSLLNELTAQNNTQYEKNTHAELQAARLAGLNGEPRTQSPLNTPESIQRAGNSVENTAIPQNLNGAKLQDTTYQPENVSNNADTISFPTNKVTIDQSSLDLAQEHLNDAAEMKEFAETPDAFKNKLMKYYENSGNERQVNVDGGVDGKAYNVTINKSTFEKVISDRNVSAEKLTILNNADALLKNSVLVGSGKVTVRTGGKTVTAQHNYFEAPVTLGGESYTARFDVTVNKATGKNVLTGIDVKKTPEVRPDTIPDRPLIGSTDNVSKQYIDQMQQMLDSGTADYKIPTLDNDAGADYNGKGKLNPTEGAGDAGNIADGGNNAKFAYKNNPMENPKAGKDIVENQNAVYGYSPDPSSERIGKFAEFDWTNKDVVSRAREARLQYHKDNESIYNIVKGMQHNGATVEEIARAANQQRNVNRLQSYIDTGNMNGYEKAVESNMRIFHNKLGMTADQAFAKYGSWDIVLEKAMSANAGMDACCGLYDDFYYLYSIGR